MTMSKTYKGLKTLLVSVLALIMAAALALVTACTNDSKNSSSESSSSSSGTTSTTTVDSHKLLNGNFEYYAESDSVTFPYKTSIRWTNSGGYLVNSSDKAPTSSATSGIISTSPEAYDKLLKTSVGSTELGEYLKKDGETFNPHSPYYYGYTEKDENMPATSAGDRVLMIHNRMKDNPAQGTAQYFYSSSSTLSLAAGEYAKLSVWVNTFGLDTEMNTNEYGAYVKVVNKVGSTEAAPLYVKNINTNGEWANVVIYIEGSQFASSTYTVYLGLGIGDEHVAAEYAEGFAFFDDVTFEVIEKNEFTDGAAKTAAYDTYKVFDKDDETATYLLLKDDMIASLAGKDDYAKNVKDDANSKTVLTYVLSHGIDTDALAATIETTFNQDAFANAEHKAEAELMKDNVAYEKLSAITEGNKLEDAKAFLGEDDEELFSGDDQFLYFNYTTPSSFTVELAEKTVPEGYLLITFWAKVKVEDAHRTSTGLSVAVIDMGDGTIDEDQYSETKIISSVIETATDNNGWKQYSVMIKNVNKSVNTATGVEEDTVPDRTFKIKVTFGPTDALLTDKYAFPKGYALVGKMGTAVIGEDEQPLLSVNNSVNLSAEIINTKYDDSDVYSFTAREGEIKNGILSQPLSTLQVYNTGNANSGVFNTQYLKTIKDISVEGLETDENNDYLQALAIGDPTGYYTGSYTVNAGSTAKITVKLATLGGATAYVNVLNRNEVPSDGNKGYDILKLSAADFKTGDNYIAGENAFTEKQYQYKFTGKDNAWKTVTFYVVAGTEDLSFSVEIWNGERFAETTTVPGLVIVDSLSIVTSNSTTYNDLIDDAELNGKTGYTDYTFTYKTVNYNEATKDSSTKEIVSYTVTEDVGIAFENDSDDEYVLLMNYLVTDYVDENYVEVIDENASNSETSSSSTTSNEDALPTEVRWLAISSLVLALALIVVLIVIIIRYFVKKSRAKRVKTTTYYDMGARDRTNEKISAKKARAAEDAADAKADEEDDEYDYDAAENIEETPAEEAPAEEAPAEETEATEEAPAEETEATEEAPAEETPAEETPAEETPADEETKKD